MSDKTVNQPNLNSKNVKPSDLTDNLQALQKENLRLREEVGRQKLHYDIIFQNAHEGIIHISPKGKILAVNHAFEESTGFSAAEIEGKSATNIAKRFLKAKDLAKMLVIISKAMAGKPVDLFEVEDNDKIFEVSPPALVDLRFGSIVVIREVTDQRRLVEELAKSEEQYQAIFEGLPEGIVYTDKKGKVLKVNQRLADMSDIAIEDIVGKNVATLAKNFLSAGTLSTALGMIANVLQGKAAQMELEYEGRILKASAPFIQEETQGMTIILRDITTSRKASEQIKNQQTDLKNLNILLGEKNTALREVISQLQQEKARIEERVLINVERLLLPALENMQKKGTRFELEYLNMLKRGLHELVSPFGEKLTSRMYSLTTREIEICNLIKNGFSSKEIGAQLNISYRTVQTQRNVIRKKLNILNQDINLRTFLLSL